MQNLPLTLVLTLSAASALKLPTAHTPTPRHHSKSQAPRMIADSDVRSSSAIIQDSRSKPGSRAVALASITMVLPPIARGVALISFVCATITAIARRRGSKSANAETAEAVEVEVMHAMYNAASSEEIKAPTVLETPVAAGESSSTAAATAEAKSSATAATTAKSEDMMAGLMLVGGILAAPLMLKAAFGKAGTAILAA
uniref:Uncharacterized protein n=1 Tax=Haptolina brevifila TaxID=156173 RepID=A0A7S2NCD6_9EUKA